MKTVLHRARVVFVYAALCGTAIFLPVTHALAQAPATSSELRQAEQLIQQGQLDQAEQIAHKAIEHNPKSVEGWNLVGMIEGSRQNSAAAINAFQKALAIAPHSVKTLNNLGMAYMQQHNADAAEKQFQTALRVKPTDAETNFNLGLVYMGRNEPARAIPHFLRVRPANLTTQFNLIRAYLQAKQNAPALRVAREVSAANKDNLQVHFTLGLLLASAREYSTAEAELERADTLSPDTFEIVYNLGQCYLRDGKFAQSGLALNRALQLKPDSVDAMVLMAQVYADQARPLDALDLLVRAHKLAPKNTDVIFLMAQISMSQNYYEDAIPLLESGVKIAPDRADLVAALGQSYYMAGKVDQAIAEFQHLLDIDKSARSYAFLGLTYRNLGRFDEAKKYLDAGLALEPRSAVCLFNLGFIAERQGDVATATRYFKQALQINPDYADALLELANVHIAARNFAAAEPLLEKFIKVSKDPGPGYYKLSMVQRSLHKTADADRALARFKSLAKSASSGPLPFQHLFDYLDNRAQLSTQQKHELDLTDLIAQAKSHPEQPQSLYLLAEGYLKAGDIENARSTVAQLDQAAASDAPTLTGAGVLLARYRLYDDAIAQFQKALALSPNADDIRFNLANAFFHKHAYKQALDAAEKVSTAGQEDNAYLNLLGDIQAHLGNASAARKLFEDSIARNPDSEQPYLSLAFVDLRTGDIPSARATLTKGLSRVPGSGTLIWGMGVVDALEDKDNAAIDNLNRAIALLPQWSATYSTLGFYYFDTGRIQKARQILNEFKQSSAHASLDIDHIAQVIDRAAASAGQDHTEPLQHKTQFLQFAISLTDRTL
ncbi:MAG: tetratricopeptide repeat protein [Acidobacteriota bacterium]|nr:tetratricopeptide repeat protein [Acidobacteriota bacterium]